MNRYHRNVTDRSWLGNASAIPERGFTIKIALWMHHDSKAVPVCGSFSGARGSARGMRAANGLRGHSSARAQEIDRAG